MILLYKRKTRKMCRLKHGRPLLLGSVLYENVKHFSLQQRKKGGLVNTVIAAAATEELMLTMITYDAEDLKLIDLSRHHGQRVCLSRWDFAKVQPLLQKQKFQNSLN